MGMSNAERMRKYRKNIKDNPEKYSKYLSKERNRYQQRKERGEIKGVDEFTNRERNLKRRKWRKEKREQRRQKKKQDEMIRNSTVTITPPNSPVPGTSAEDERQRRGRQKVKRDRAKAYREIKKLKEQLKKKDRQVDKYRKRYQRLKTSVADSPKKKLSAKLKNSKVDHETKRELLFNSIVVREIKRKMNDMRHQRDKQLVSKIFAGKVLKKYHLTPFCEKLGVSRKRMNANEKRCPGMIYSRKPHRNRVGIHVRKKVCDFLE